MFFLGVFSRPYAPFFRPPIHPPFQPLSFLFLAGTYFSHALILESSISVSPSGASAFPREQDPPSPSSVASQRRPKRSVRGLQPTSRDHRTTRELRSILPTPIHSISPSPLSLSSLSYLFYAHVLSSVTASIDRRKPDYYHIEKL